MSSRPYNFSAGPSTLPVSVLEQASIEMTNWNNTGMSVMEMSHRSKNYEEIQHNTIELLRKLLNVPDNYQILLMQGGATVQNALVPLNLLKPNQKAAYVISGQWSAKSAKEAQKYGSIDIIADGHPVRYKTFPQCPPTVDPAYAYVHYCSNETIDGLQINDFTERLYHPIIVADMSSDILSKPINVNQYGVIYAGAQKNIGPAGVTIIIVRNDLLNWAHPSCPSALTWSLVAQHHSMYNTPPTYSIYLMGLVLQWLSDQGGVNAIEKINQEKARLLYNAIDTIELFSNDIDPNYRSLMNVPFFLNDTSRETIFLEQAEKQGLLNLKGHKSVGGLRASLYNAMPIEGVQALIDFMREFAQSKN